MPISRSEGTLNQATKHTRMVLCKTYELWCPKITISTPSHAQLQHTNNSNPAYLLRTETMSRPSRPPTHSTQCRVKRVMHIFSHTNNNHNHNNINVIYTHFHAHSRLSTLHTDCGCVRVCVVGGLNPIMADRIMRTACTYVMWWLNLRAQNAGDVMCL